MDLYEVIENLDKICKGSKFTFEEHQYLHNGLAEIKKRLERLDELEKKETK